MAKTLHFKSKKGYKKWLAYEHIHHVGKRHRKGNYPRVRIHGRPHKVKHHRR